jgi:hypothetical protein
MTGALMQMVACGAQDVYLTSNPHITFFKVMYRRYTNFAVESIEQYFNGTTNFGRKSAVDISRNGDLITQILLRVILPEVKFSGSFERFRHVEFAWVRRIGHAMLDEIELEIGGAQIDKQYGYWLNIWYELTHKVGQDYGYAKMVGDIPELTAISTLNWDNSEQTVLKPQYALYVPFQFYFCRNNGLALPLIALQYHQVRIYVRFKPVEQLYISSEAFKSGYENLNIEEASLWVNYIFLDTDERRRFAQASHEYLIEQLQFTGEESIGFSNIGKYRLNFNHPVKAIYWVTILGNYQGGRFTVYEPYDWGLARINAAKLILLSQFDLDEFGYFRPVPEDCMAGGIYVSERGIEYEAINPSSPTQEANYVFNDVYTAEKFASDNMRLIGKLAKHVCLLKREKGDDWRYKIDGIIRIYSDRESEDLFYPEVDRVLRNDLSIIDLSIPLEKFVCDNRTSYIQRFDVTVWQHINYGLLIDGTVNPVTVAQLQLNGQDRLSKRNGFWYDTVEPYLYFPDTPHDGVNVYSFALRPEDHQPSGTCNFSRIDTANLNLWFYSPEVAGHYINNFQYCEVFCNSDSKVLIYGVNYNVLRIMSGMGGLAYSS